jgi:RNA polymerase sigma-70 factor (ECF subfamily)
MRFRLGRGPSRERRAEAKLLARAAGGDSRALERIYEANVDGLYAFVFYRVGRDEALAEDVVQETFANALDHIDRYDAGRGSVQSWLCTMSRNVIRDQLRAHRRSIELAATWDRIDETLAQIFEALDRAPLSDEVIARAETRDVVNMTIANLPEHYRDVLEHKYVAGETIEEIAGRLELSNDATKSLLARARRAFRDTFATLCQSMAEANR